MYVYMPVTGEITEVNEALRALRNAFVTVGAFSGFINLMMLAPALYMLQVYDRVLGSRNETTLVMLTVLVVGALLFMADPTVSISIDAFEPYLVAI